MRRRNIGNECVEYLERKISEGSAKVAEKNFFCDCDGIQSSFLSRLTLN